MRGRIRNLDSKISFFAFADIITAVCGMLIFITLLLAMELIHPSSKGMPAEDPALKQSLQEVAKQKVVIDEENQRLNRLLVISETTASPEQLAADITALQATIQDQQRKLDVLDKAVSSAYATNALQDEKLGINDRRLQIEELEETNAVTSSQEARANQSVKDLEHQVADEQAHLLKLKALEGQIWLVPDNSKSGQEPLLVVVSGDGIEMDRFDHPEAHKQFAAASAGASFSAALAQANSAQQYFVFLVRPSGIKLFKDLAEVAHHGGFEVGSDALEENEAVHFSTPPPDDPSTPEPRPPHQNTDGTPAVFDLGGNGTPLTRQDHTAGADGLPGNDSHSNNRGNSGAPGNSGGAGNAGNTGNSGNAGGNGDDKVSHSATGDGGGAASGGQPGGSNGSGSSNGAGENAGGGNSHGLGNSDGSPGNASGTGDSKGEKNSASPTGDAQGGSNGNQRNGSGSNSGGSSGNDNDTQGASHSGGNSSGTSSGNAQSNDGGGATGSGNQNNSHGSSSGQNHATDNNQDASQAPPALQPPPQPAPVPTPPGMNQIPQPRPQPVQLNWWQRLLKAIGLN